MPPSSGLRPAFPLKGEAVKCASFTQVTASPLEGRSWRSLMRVSIEYKLNSSIQSLILLKQFFIKNFKTSYKKFLHSFFQVLLSIRT